MLIEFDWEAEVIAHLPAVSPQHFWRQPCRAVRRELPARHD
jgi:hypothetical protein